MHTEEETNKLRKAVALLEDELNTMRTRMQNVQSIILSNISHDIRTPMNAIVGFANLLTDENMQTGERNECIDHINLHSKELLGIIDNMIDASQLQCGGIKLKEKECYINDILDEIYEESLESRHVSLKNLNIIVSKGESDDFFIYADFDRLKQILRNLIENAVKFTNKGYVEFGYTKKKPNKVTFFVKDTGPGLGSVNREELFKPFRGGHKSRPHDFVKGAGLGLGLSISKSLVELMNGEMWPDSKPGKGTCFYFTLPVRKTSFFKTKLKQLSSMAKQNIASIF